MNMAEEKIKTENSLNTGRIQGEVEYKVGNKKPPKEYQWKPGHSGNKKGKEKGNVSPIARVKRIFKQNPKAFKEFILGYIKDPHNRQHIVEMIDGQPTKPIDLTTGGESFFRPTKEEKIKALKALGEIE